MEVDIGFDLAELAINRHWPCSRLAIGTVQHHPATEPKAPPTLFHGELSSASSRADSRRYGPTWPRPKVLARRRCQPFRVQLSDVFLQHYQERAELKLLCTVQGFSPGSSENWYRPRVEVPAVPFGLMTALLRSSPHSTKWFMQLSRRHRAQTPFHWSAVRKLFNLIPLRLHEH